jgi:RimJ/RimL family protein N-acetyltransferase
MPGFPLPEPPLSDDAVRLRPWSSADLDAALAATQDPLIQRFTRVPADQTMAQLREYVDGRDDARKTGEELALVIADTRTDDLLGTVSLLRFAWDERRGEIGYWVAPEARGRGVATRAVTLLSRWALRELPLERLALHTDRENLASQLVAERCGFTREGVLRSWEARAGRPRHDLVIFSLLRADLA